MSFLWKYSQTILSLFLLMIPFIMVSGSDAYILRDNDYTDSKNPVKAMSESVAGSSVSFSYRYDAVRGSGRISGEGKAALQGRAYMIDVDGLKFLCDGSSKWSVDHASREVVIETADSGVDGYCSNPILLIVSADTMFEEESVENVDFNGFQTLCINMKPKVACGLESVSLYFRGDVLSGARAVAGDGTETSLIISDFRKTEKKDLSYFIFDDKSLDSSWVITDLR